MDGEKGGRKWVHEQGGAGVLTEKNGIQMII